MGIAESIFRLFANKIEVDLLPDEFTVRCKDKSFTFGTFIDLSTDNKRTKVVGAGGNPQPNEPYLRIPLFKSPVENNSKYDLPELLDAFMRHIFRRVVNRSALVRPKVIFRNINSFDQYLSGYQKIVLDHSAKMAGALECIFMP
jgi:hypothetical protein